MKKVFVGVCYLFLFQIANAQKTELKISTGYHFSAGSQYFLTEVDNSYGSYSTKKIDASLGKGLELAVGLNYSLRSWLSLSLDVNYKKTLPAVKGEINTNTFTDYTYYEENKWSSQLTNLSPSVMLKFSAKKINPYSKFGIVLPIYSRIEVKGNYRATSFGQQVNTGENTKIFRLKNTIGYAASMGIAPELNKKISFIAEVRLSTQSIQAKKSTLTSEISNGVERVDGYTVAAKETIYVKKLSNQTYDPNVPRKELGFSLPYSSIGLNVGLSIKL